MSANQSDRRLLIDQLAWLEAMGIEEALLDDAADDTTVTLSALAALAGLAGLAWLAGALVSLGRWLAGCWPWVGTCPDRAPMGHHNCRPPYGADQNLTSSSSPPSHISRSSM